MVTPGDDPTRAAAGRVLAHQAAVRMGRPDQSPYGGGFDWRPSDEFLDDAAYVAAAWLEERGVDDDTDDPRPFPRLYAG